MSPAPRPFELDPERVKVEQLPPEVGLVEGEEIQDGSPPPPRRRGWRGRLVGFFGLGVLGMLVLQSVDYIGGLLATDPILGWPLAALLVVVVTSGLAWVGLEVRDLRRLSARSHLRRTAERLAASELHDEAPGLIAAVTSELGETPELAPALARFAASQNDALSDGERLRLFERQVLSPLDKRAYRLVLHGSRDIGVLTALSPLGLLDGVLVLWRTTAMLRAIAGLYGMAPGPAATLSLLRLCARNATLAGLADILTHAALEHASAGILALMSARAGQGAGNALLAARLGLEGIQQCRPLPFVAEERPRLSRIRESILETLPADKVPEKVRR